MKENKVTTYVDEELYKWLDIEASKIGLTISGIVRMFLTKSYNEKQEQETNEKQN